MDEKFSTKIWHLSEKSRKYFLKISRLRKGIFSQMDLPISNKILFYCYHDFQEFIQNYEHNRLYLIKDNSQQLNIIVKCIDNY